MTHVYLTGIELSEFRTFEKLRIDLAPEPGVLIVHGSNGLGKSSLFDALQWTLTGDIDHFTSVDGYQKFGKYLCRWGDRSEPTTAAMLFSDGISIERRLAGRAAKESTVNGVPDIAEYLRLPDWEAPIASLSRYLLLTHFLGQSSLSRLTHRKPSERLEILKEVSRSAALQKFGLALHGPGQTTPARAFAKRIGQLERDVAGLHDLLVQEEVLWTGAQASGALDDAEASRMSGEIGAALAIVWSKVRAASVPPGGGVPPDLDGIQSATDRGAELVRERDFAISEARRLVAQRDRLDKARTEGAVGQTLAERELAQTRALLDRARQEADQRAKVLAEATGPLAAARDARAKALALREAAGRRSVARKQWQAADMDMAQARAALDEAERASQRSDRRARLVGRLRDEAAQLDRDTTDLRLRIDRAQEWLDRAQAIAAVDREWRELTAHNPDIDSRAAAAAIALASAEANERTASDLLSSVEDTVGSLSAAVSTVAAHIAGDAHDCPVCATHFPENGELAARAEAVAERLAPLVVTHQKALSDAKEARVTAANTLSGITGIQQRLADLVEQIRADRAANERVALALDLAVDVPRPEVEDWLAEQHREFSRLAAAHRRRTRWLGRLATDENASSRGGDAARQRDAARVNLATAARRLDDLAIEEKVLSDRFDALAAQLFAQGQATGEGIKAAIDAATERLAAAETVYAKAAAAVSEHELDMAPLREAEAKLQARVEQAAINHENARTALSALSQEWLALGWSAEDMETSRIEVFASELNEAHQALAQSTMLLDRLRAGREAWSRQLAHRAAFERLRNVVDLAPNSTRDQVRGAAAQSLEAKKSDAAATVQSKKIASSASDLIAEAVSAFNSAYLDPLKVLTNRINQAILCDPRIGIDLTLQKRGIKQSASVAGEMPKDLDMVDPMLVHSEGQMAALAVSMLSAASLTYPWSRWRALVLDDPLQHNDSIHAAAFADFVGNMVRAKDYQVLLTTHDLAQAEFLKRKFGARNIPCSILHLLGRGESGVDWAFQPSSGGQQQVAAAT